MQMFIRKLIKSLPNMQVFIYSSIKSLCVGSVLLDTRLPAAERQIITDAFAPYQDKGIQLGACHFCKSAEILQRALWRGLEALLPSPSPNPVSSIPVLA